MFRHSMIDRARTVRKIKSAERVEGSFVETQEFGPWFRCRFEPGDEREERSEGAVRRRRTGPQLITGSRDINGLPLALSPSDMVQVQSQIQGTYNLQIDSAPEPIGRGRVVSGWILTVSRVNPASSG